MVVGLVGRGAEQRRIEQLLDAVSEGGAGGVSMVVGPKGIGKTALLEAAAAAATRRGIPVTRAAVARRPTGPDLLVWAQLVRDLVGDDHPLPRALLERPTPLDLDAVARLVAGAGPRLVIIDDIDVAGRPAVDLLALVEGRVRSSDVVVLSSSAEALGVAPELRLPPLRERDLTPFAPGEDGAIRALWVASRGIPGRVRELAELVASRPEGVDPLVHLALHAPTRAGFLEPDLDLVRLVEEALTVAVDPTTRAPLLARLAAALLGDPSAAERRRSLADEAVDIARAAQDPRVLADVLSRRLHARWDPDAAEARLADGHEIETLARAAGDATRQREGSFWQFVALMELGRVTEAEVVLSAYERSAAADGDRAAAVMAVARRAMLAILRGRFDAAAHLTARAAEEAQRAGLPDAASVAGALRAALAVEREPSALDDLIVLLDQMADQLPGHLYEATAARLRVVAGRVPEAVLDMERVLSRALRSTGPRWLGAVADLATVAVVAGDVDAAARIRAALAPYRGRLVVFGGAVTVWGPVSSYLGRLALAAGRVDEAIADLEEAAALCERVGALPALVHSLDALADARTARGAEGDADAAAGHRAHAHRLATSLGMDVFLGASAPRGDEWSLERDGADWLLRAGAEQARLRDGRGMDYLRALVASPGADVAALDLAAGGRGLVAPPAEPTLDRAALDAFRRRLRELDEVLDDADAAGDVEAARRAADERDALVRELQRATRPGGRPRRTSPEAERARVNVTRTLRATIERIADVAPLAGAHLRASVRTGLACRYDPAPGGPARWRV